MKNEATVTNESNFNILQSKIRLLEDDRGKLENKIANNFASFWCFIYFLILLLIVVLLCFYISQPEGWNRLEPITFIVGFGWFSLNFLLQSLFTGKFPSFDPRELFNSLKQWKKRKLEKFRIDTTV